VCQMHVCTCKIHVYEVYAAVGALGDARLQGVRYMIFENGKVGGHITAHQTTSGNLGPGLPTPSNPRLDGARVTRSHPSDHAWKPRPRPASNPRLDNARAIRYAPTRSRPEI
jgi:hypothetical protein